MKEEKQYLQPLRDCSKRLTDANGINYVILVSDAIPDSDDVIKFVGGSGWNVEDNSNPDFFSMVGGLLEHYLSESSLSYIDKLKLIREFSSNLVENITKESEDKNGR